MTPINSNTPASFFTSRQINRVQTASPLPGAVDEFQVDQGASDAPGLNVTDRLPQALAKVLAGVFTNINILALQSAELGLTQDTREALNNQAADELSGLRTTLDDLYKDDLELFGAIFENQLPDFFSSANGSRQLDFLSAGSFDSILTSIFQIDLRTGQGALSALNLSGSILEILPVFNSGGNSVLETLLDDVAGVSFNLAVIDSILSNSETGTASDTADDQEFPEPVSPFVSPDTGQPTIIELAG